METLASRASMRGTSPPSGTSDGFRDTMIFGYIDHMAGARANSSECFACIGYLRSEAIDDDVQLPVLANMIANLSKGVAAARGRRSSERHAGDDVDLLPVFDAARREHGVGLRELDILRKACRQAFHRERRTRRLRVACRDEQ